MNPQLDVDKLLSSFPRDVHQIVDLSTLLPRPTLEELADENVKFVLSDFGSGMSSEDCLAESVRTPGSIYYPAALLDRPSPKEYHSQPSLLPPEILIGDKWDQSVDIWNLGTMVLQDHPFPPFSLSLSHFHLIRLTTSSPVNNYSLLPRPGNS